MITLQPQLDLQTVLRMPRSSFLAAWERQGDTAVLTSRTTASIVALVRTVAARNSRPTELWAPDYFHKVTLQPLAAEPVNLRTYPVDLSAEPDWKQIHVMTGRPDVFLLAHFQGGVADATLARQFCNERGALLLEDAATILTPEPGVGENGDFVLYSPWKFVGLPNGAIAVCRPRASEWREPFLKSLAEAGPGRAWGLSSLRTALIGSKPSPGLIEDDAFNIDPHVVVWSRRGKPTPLAAFFLARQRWEELARERRERAAIIGDHLGAVGGFQTLFRRSSHAPFRVAFRADTPQLAMAAWKVCRQSGIEADRWPALSASVPPDSVAAQLRRTVLYFPCHQQIDKQALGVSLGTAFPEGDSQSPSN